MSKKKSKHGRNNLLLAFAAVVLALLYFSAKPQAQTVIIHEGNPNPAGTQTLGNP